MPGVLVPDKGGDTFSCVDLDSGYRVPLFDKTAETILEIWKNLDNLKCREDDILLCSYPKTGTNWLFEILTMMQNKKAEKDNSTKLSSNIEASPQEGIDALPSPRILNTHNHFRFLPPGIKEKGLRTVLVVRNPKDTAVSYFNHFRSLVFYNYSGKWENWLPCYVNGEFEYGTYESYLLEWEKAMQEDPGFPIHLLYYEDMKEDGVAEIMKLAKFLGVDIDRELCVDIEKACQFKTMKENKRYAEMDKAVTKENTSFFRKGEVGDWKNWFTVAQNEMFEEKWNERMKGSKLKFKYVPSA